MELEPAKTRGMGLGPTYGEKFIMRTSTVLDWSAGVAERRTDGRQRAKHMLCCGALNKKPSCR